MIPIRVNADYESELFSGKKPPAIINQSLEFLAFFLTDRTLYSSKNYSPEYLDYVESKTGHRPEIVSSGEFENWWGSLKNIELERTLNSKMTSFNLNKTLELDPDSLIVNKPDDFLRLLMDKPYLIKDPFGMSGIGLKIISKEEEFAFFKKFPLIAEPLRKRVYDFSHYCFSDGEIIAYENVVDDFFQYKGTVFQNHFKPNLHQLSFYEQIDERKWKLFQNNLKKIIDHYLSFQNDQGFSVDSFIYEKNQSYFIRELSEVNYRKTMGSICYGLAKKYAQDFPWCAFLLCKANQLKFSEIKSRISSFHQVMILSPDDVRFLMFFVFAEDKFQGKEILENLSSLLPECQFAINI
jgi:hypothetical protein